VIIVLNCNFKAYVNAIYSATYKDVSGNQKISYNLEVFNPEYTGKFDRYLTLTIDRDCWTRLKLDDSRKTLERKELNLICSIRPYKVGVGLIVLDILQ